ncbi:MAG TPA: LysM peptidoglycan-binding domain-containing protein [Cyclobacteriaceae bacterium]
MIKLVLLVSHLVIGSEATQLSDSLRLETIGGQSFIIHQVDEKETLYGISRRYSVSLSQIIEYNKEADAGLEVGQILRVPYIPGTYKAVQKSKDYHIVAPGETLFSISRLYGLTVDEIKSQNQMTDNALSVGQQLMINKSSTALVENQPLQNVPVREGYHRVLPKETLFSISRDYGVTIQQLKEWNDLAGSNLDIGQMIRVASTDLSTAKENTQDTTYKVVTAPTPTVGFKETVVKISENVAGTDEVKESGLAELIDGTEGNRKYLALHRNAKPGTILKVRNELNNREVFVRVVGPLPATGVNSNIIIKISKSAFDRLGGVDTKFRAEVTYYK